MLRPHLRLRLHPSIKTRGPSAWIAPAALAAILASAAGCTPDGASTPAADAGAPAEVKGKDPNKKIEHAQQATDEHGAPTPASAWEVHEWGVFSVPPGAKTAQLRTAPGRLPAPGKSNDGDRPMATRKPVLYVHLGKGVESVEFGLKVAPPDGRVIEHWPRVTPAGSVDAAIEWKSVRAHAGPCKLDAWAYPTGIDPLCATSDRVCEVADLALVHTPEGACVTVGEVDYEHLFYRGELPTPQFPVAIEVSPSGARRLVHLAGRPTLGKALYVHAGPRRADTRVDILDALTDGAMIELAPRATGTDVDAGIAWLRAELQAQGLSAEEAEAFMRAWESDMFGAAEGSTASRERDALSPPARRSQPVGGTADYVAIFVDRATIDTLLPLDFSPAPTRLQRVHLLVLEIAHK